MPFDQWSVVVVPFPFVDPWDWRLRPALVISDPRSLGNLAGLSVLAMVTSATHSPWPLDVPVTDLASAGLPAPAIVRMKLFTLDDRFVERTAGVLAPADSAGVAASLARLIGSGAPASTAGRRAKASAEVPPESQAEVPPESQAEVRPESQAEVRPES